jgi:hypothetical protein
MNRIIKNVVKFSTLNITNDFRPTVEILAFALQVFNNLADFFPDEYRYINKEYVRYVANILNNQNGLYSELINRAISVYKSTYGRNESLI